jgi:hypothetical protein
MTMTHDSRPGYLLDQGLWHVDAELHFRVGVA